MLRTSLHLLARDSVALILLLHFSIKVKMIMRWSKSFKVDNSRTLRHHFILSDHRLP